MFLKLLKKKNYLTMIENAAKGENWMFRNLYAEIDGQEADILKDGGLSCAVFVSSILYLHKLIKDIHANTYSVENDMIQSGWIETEDLKLGAVLIWEERMAKDEPRKIPHIGFYISNGEAISNDSRGSGFPYRHHYTYNGTRKIKKIYWHKELDD